MGNDIKAKLTTKYQASPAELAAEMGISKRAVFSQLAKLYAKGEIEKIGSAPKTYYYIKEPQTAYNHATLSEEEKAVIDEHFTYITPLGDYLQGTAAFHRWCADRELDPAQQAQQYLKVRDDVYQGQSKAGDLIDATHKLESSFDQIALEKLYYLDFYALPQFEKTRLGQLILYAKQSQDSKRIRQIAQDVHLQIEQLIATKHIDAVGFIPPTAKREVQFMYELRKSLSIDLPHIKLAKLKNEFTIPQKSLNKLKDRILNASRTIVAEDYRQLYKVLLIDDAVGSGATLNQTALNLKRRGIAQRVYGVALVGSYKGFDVISEI